MADDGYIFRARRRDDTVDEVELTREQALELAVGRPIDQQGTITHRESAVPHDPEDQERKRKFSR